MSSREKFLNIKKKHAREILTVYNEETDDSLSIRWSLDPNIQRMVTIKKKKQDGLHSRN